jgi:hypothetical protein
VQADDCFNSSWQLEEAVEVLAALLSVDTYERLVVEQRWQPEQLISRIWELSRTFLLEATPRKPSPKKRLER